MDYKTEQEQFWIGEFGNDYVDRNRSTKNVACNIVQFSDIMQHTSGIQTVLEFGSNIGQNLQAIRTLFPEIRCSAIEINHKAAEVLRNNPLLKDTEVYETSILQFEPKEKYDFVFTKGVLIHMNPDELQDIYQKLYDSSKKYICMIEYYNPTPVTISYRGHDDKLFKRDFCGEFLDKFPDIKLIDYGFKYHRDNNFPLDDATWFLMEK